MARIQIALVGGQAAPVYQGIVALHPDSVCYVCSKSSYEIVQHVQSIVKVPKRIMTVDPVNINDIRDKALLCFEKYKEDEVSVNISGGTKSWAYYFITIFLRHSHCTIFYIDQNNILWDLTKNASSHIGCLDNMDVLFKLHGNELKTYRTLDNYSEEDDVMASQIAKIRRNNFEDFAKLTREDKPYKTKDTYILKTLKTGSYLELNRKGHSCEIGLKKREGNIIVSTLESPKIIDLILNTGWFEYRVAKILSSWDKCRDLRLNCVFSTTNNMSKNEVDIIVNTGAKLLFVECKTQVSKITDVDKFNSVIRNYAGLGGKSLFVTDRDMNSSALEKCKEYHIPTFALHKRGRDEVSLKRELFSLLDNEITNINQK